MVRIVTDTTCDLPEAIIEDLGIQTIPLYINIGEKSYLDQVEMTRAQFYEGLPKFENHPTTAVPGIDAFLKVYERIAQEGADAIISMHIGKALSNVVNVAELAAKKFTKIPVVVLDPGNLTLGTGLLARQAALMARAGENVKEIASAVMDKAKRTYTFAMLNTLEFLRRSGRLSNFQFGLGSLLILRPILKMNDGKTYMEKTRTTKGALNRLLQLVEELGSLEELAFVHTHAPEKVENLRQSASHLIPSGKEILVGEVTPVIGSHIGPGAVGFSVVKA